MMRRIVTRVIVSRCVIGCLWVVGQVSGVFA